MERQIETIVELQQALDELQDARDRLEGIPEWMSDLHEEHSARKSEIDELDEAIQTALLERRGAETEMQEDQGKVKTFQEQISRVRNQREYGALLQEIDTTKDQIKALEEQAFEAMERQETAQQERNEKREEFQELDDRYSVELKKWEAEKPRVAKDAKTLEEKIDGLRKLLPQNALQLFERIFERHGGHALASVHRMVRAKGPQVWHCGGCNYRVRPQAVVEITNNGSVVPCDSCKRILYIAEGSG